MRKQKTLTILTFLAAAAVLVLLNFWASSCSKKKSTNPPPTGPTASVSATRASIDPDPTVCGRPNWSPNPLTIAKGTTVNWVTNDPYAAVPHSGRFVSGPENFGIKTSFTFNVPGTYTYGCGSHPCMDSTAQIIVNP